LKNNEECFKTPGLDKHEHAALKALHKGDASEHQQRLALHVIVNKLSRAHDVLFIPGSSDESAFLSGRAFVGQKILKYLNVPIGKLKQQEENNNVEK